MSGPSNRIDRPYGGYLRGPEPAEDAELTHVGPGTPGGEYLRRFWQPVALAEELGERPLAVEMLGEALVLFRTGSGEIGLLERHCSHRGASLEFGIPSAQGLRCCYHGWHYGVDGGLLETPNDPGCRLAGRLYHPAYPLQETGGIIFAYMGPPDDTPPFPAFDTCAESDNELVPFSLHYPCNWLQVLENTQDPVHSVFLHARISGIQFAESWGELPEVDYVETPLGMTNVNMRRWKSMVWFRTTEVILPNINQAGALYETAEAEKTLARVSLTRWMRPVDDRSTRIIGWRHFNTHVDAGLGRRDEVGLNKIDFVGQTEERAYAEAQRIPGDFEAIVSQRPIALHALENLTGSDRGVALLRRLIRRGIRKVGDGQTLDSPLLASTSTLSTYTQDTVREIAPAEDDLKLLKDVGAAGVASLLASAGAASEARAEQLDRQLKAFVSQT